MTEPLSQQATAMLNALLTGSDPASIALRTRTTAAQTPSSRQPQNETGYAATTPPGSPATQQSSDTRSRKADATTAHPARWAVRRLGQVMTWFPST
ncbi:hypothetical protein [Streptomyces sp. NPDC001820]|uniref:hypothetical protein n=1 Tax=Streptomyces sp. NPDC001820 TaxID=3364613 RepID=UPI003673B607